MLSKTVVGAIIADWFWFIIQGSADPCMKEQTIIRDIVTNQQQQPLTTAIVIPC